MKTYIAKIEYVEDLDVNPRVEFFEFEASGIDYTTARETADALNANDTSAEVVALFEQVWPS